LAAAASRATSKLSLALDHLALLADEHEISFAVARAISAEQVQVLERFYPPRGVHVGIVVGDAYGPFDGALGKCLLAQMDGDRAAELIDQRELPAHTSATITDAGELLAEVARVRARGWGASARELNENNAVAAFVPEPAGRSELYLLALGFANQLTDERIPAVGALLRATAEAIAAGRPASTAAPAAAERPA
jgi:DNA-binding IclR family transcriptional regulator